MSEYNRYSLCNAICSKEYKEQEKWKYRRNWIILIIIVILCIMLIINIGIIMNQNNQNYSCSDTNSPEDIPHNNILYGAIDIINDGKDLNDSKIKSISDKLDEFIKNETIIKDKFVEFSKIESVLNSNDSDNDKVTKSSALWKVYDESEEKGLFSSDLVKSTDKIKNLKLAFDIEKNENMDKQRYLDIMTTARKALGDTTLNNETKMWNVYSALKKWADNDQQQINKIIKNNKDERMLKTAKLKESQSTYKANTIAEIVLSCLGIVAMGIIYWINNKPSKYAKYDAKLNDITLLQYIKKSLKQNNIRLDSNNAEIRRAGIKIKAIETSRQAMQSISNKLNRNKNDVKSGEGEGDTLTELKDKVNKLLEENKILKENIAKDEKEFKDLEKINNDYNKLLKIDIGITNDLYYLQENFNNDTATIYLTKYNNMKDRNLENEMRNLLASNKLNDNERRNVNEIIEFFNVAYNNIFNVALGYLNYKKQIEDIKTNNIEDFDKLIGLIINGTIYDAIKNNIIEFNNSKAKSKINLSFFVRYIDNATVLKDNKFNEFMNLIDEQIKNKNNLSSFKSILSNSLNKLPSTATSYRDTINNKISAIDKNMDLGETIDGEASELLNVVRSNTPKVKGPSFFETASNLITNK